MSQIHMYALLPFANYRRWPQWLLRGLDKRHKHSHNLRPCAFGPIHFQSSCLRPSFQWRRFWNLFELIRLSGSAHVRKVQTAKMFDTSFARPTASNFWLIVRLNSPSRRSVRCWHVQKDRRGDMTESLPHAAYPIPETRMFCRCEQLCKKNYY
jgi:hypothetical protein